MKWLTNEYSVGDIVYIPTYNELYVITDRNERYITYSCINRKYKLRKQSNFRDVTVRKNYEKRVIKIGYYDRYR